MTGGANMFSIFSSKDRKNFFHNSSVTEMIDLSIFIRNARHPSRGFKLSHKSCLPWDFFFRLLFCFVCFFFACVRVCV